MSAVIKSIPQTAETFEIQQDQLNLAAADPKLYQKIAELAYYKAEQRGFAPGHEQEDWLEAENELLDII